MVENKFNGMDGRVGQIETVPFDVLNRYYRAAANLKEEGHTVVRLEILGLPGSRYGQGIVPVGKFVISIGAGNSPGDLIQWRNAIASLDGTLPS